VLNCGFPINFSGDPALTDPTIFQLTRSLLVAAMLSGVCGKTRFNGLIPLAKEIQDTIITCHQDMYAKEPNDH